MTGAFDLRRAGAERPGNRWRSVAGWFRVVALLEAVSWAGLLVGMYFKYLASSPTEIGVKVFGMAHGLIFIAFVVVALLTGFAFKWAIGTWLLALIASIVPLGSVIFLIWADRTGKMDVGAPAAAIIQPGQPVPETT
jgi:integral membrane protein